MVNSRFLRFLNRHWRVFAVLSIVCWSITLAGCGPLTWLTDAQQIIPIATSILSGVLTFIGALTGSTVLASVAVTITNVLGKAAKVVADVQAAVQDYQANPSPTLLGSIQQGVQTAIEYISGLLTDTGITDPATQQKVVDFLTLFKNELTALQSMLPALNAHAGQTVTIIVPMTSKEAKAAYNAILSVPTGNTAVDSALAQLKHL